MRPLLNLLGEPVFNSYDILICVILIESVLLSVFYLFHSRILIGFYARLNGESSEQTSKRRHSARLLAGFLLLVGLTELVFLLTYNPIIYRSIHPHFGDWAFTSMALVFFFSGAVLYRYVTSLVVIGDLSLRIYLLPVGLFLMAILVSPLGLFGPKLEALFWKPHIMVAAVAFSLNTIFAVLTYRHLRHYQQEIHHYFANPDTVDIRWLVLVTVGFGLIWGLALVPPFMSQQNFPILREVIIHLPSLLKITLLTVAILFGLSQGVRIVRLLPENGVKDEVEPELQKTPDTSAVLLPRLQELMQQQHWYRRPDITVEQFAEVAGAPVKQVSQAINRHFEKNFYEFVNHYRIEEIKQNLRRENPSRVSIQKIYESAGFRSKSSFNTLFRKWVGMTPSEYRKKYCANLVQDQAAIE